MWAGNRGGWAEWVGVDGFGYGEVDLVGGRKKGVGKSRYSNQGCVCS